MKLTDLMWLILVGSHSQAKGILNPHIFMEINGEELDDLIPFYIRNLLHELHHEAS